MSDKLEKSFHKALAATKPGKSDCYILSADVMERYAERFPLSRSGWTAAHKHAVAVSQTHGAAYATLICPTGAIPLYQCYKGSCQIEGSEGDVVIAGARRRRK